MISTDEAAADVEGDTTWDRLLGWARDEVFLLMGLPRMEGDTTWGRRRFGP